MVVVGIEEATGQLCEEAVITSQGEKAEEHMDQNEIREDLPIPEEEHHLMEKVISMLGVKQVLEEAKELNSEAKCNISRKTLVGKDGEAQAESSKKLKHSPKQVPRTKPTIPQPFSLATEKRLMSRKRRGSMDLSSATEKKVNQEKQTSATPKDPQPEKKLSRSASLSLAGKSLTSNIRGVPNLKRCATTPTNRSTRSLVVASESGDKKIEQKGVGPKGKVQVKSRYLQFLSKKHLPEESGDKKLQKVPTHKASPLPRFYNRKDSTSKPETKKIPASNPKAAPLGGQTNKPTPTIPENRKLGDKCQTRSASKIISSSSSGKETRTIRSSVKESISKLFKTTKKPLATSKETVKCVASKA